MSYQVIKKFQGSIIQVFEGIEAWSALEAIARIELECNDKQFSGVLGEGQNARKYTWSRFEYEARPRGMWLPL